MTSTRPRGLLTTPGARCRSPEPHAHGDRRALDAAARGASLRDRCRSLSTAGCGCRCRCRCCRPHVPPTPSPVIAARRPPQRSRNAPRPQPKFSSHRPASIALCCRPSPAVHATPHHALTTPTRLPARAATVAPRAPVARPRPRAPDLPQSYRGMNTALTAYTTLESLLLFQSLHAYGVKPQVFGKISDLLKTNPYITADKRFETGRLSPDALRSVYLQILKDEIKEEQLQLASDADANVTNGHVKPSRKRKAPSPSLPNVQESLQHQHLIPKLVNKLYARYRAGIVEQIRQDEENYERLQRDLQSIERGEWDQQLKERANRKTASQSPNLSRKSPLPPQQPSPFQQNSNTPDTQPVNATASLAPTPGWKGPTNTTLPQNGQFPGKTGPGPSPRKKQGPAEKLGKKAAEQSRSAPSPGPQPPHTPRPLASHPTHQGHPHGNPPYTGHPLANQPPHLQPHSSTPGVQGAPTPGSQHPPYQGFPQHLQSGHVPFQQHGQPFGPNGVPQLAPNAGGQPPQHSPTHQRFMASQQPGSQSPHVQTPPQQRAYIPIAGQPPYLPQHPHPGQPPPQGGFMLPPFQVAPQDPSRSHQQTAHVPQQHPVSTPVSGRQNSAKVTPQAGRQGVTPMQPLNSRSNSFTTPVNVRAIISALSTPDTGKTAWKPTARSQKGTPVSRPNVSPIDDFEPTQDQEKSAPKSKPTRKSRAKGKAKEKEKEPEPENEARLGSEPQTEETVPEIETRQGRSSRRKVPAKRGRPGSLASSHAGTSVRGRSRSHSILSHTETIAADTESQAGSRIKSEDAVDEDLPATPSQMSTRGRSAAKPNNKRKRNVRELTPEDSEDRSHTPGLPKTVSAPRHFSRMSAPLMNDIGSHKHASTFTTAVKAKDAEGYYEILKRPTDLKTIQKAIAVGAKQVVAAASGDTPSGSPGGAGGVVELPFTPDNVPPKAIVNSAQLEKELMRMFVNAVMFNAGEEGVVEDAREMFESVQRSVSSWRSVETRSGRLEVEETPPVGEEDGPVEKKRRKL